MPYVCSGRPRGQVGNVVDVSSEVYKFVRLFVHLTRCLYAECGGGLRHPLQNGG